MKYERVRFFLLGGWAIFLGTSTFAIWLGQPGHRFYLSARALSENHRITREDLIPAPGSDTPQLGRYVRASGICKWSPIWRDDLAGLPTVKIPNDQVPVWLDLVPQMTDSINQGSRLDVWDRSTHEHLLANVPVLAVICDTKSCKAIVSAAKPAAQKIQPANVELLIRSY